MALRARWTKSSNRWS